MFMLSIHVCTTDKTKQEMIDDNYCYFFFCNVPLHFSDFFFFYLNHQNCIDLLVFYSVMRLLSDEEILNHMISKTPMMHDEPSLQAKTMTGQVPDVQLMSARAFYVSEAVICVNASQLVRQTRMDRNPTC